MRWRVGECMNVLPFSLPSLHRRLDVYLAKRRLQGSLHQQKIASRCTWNTTIRTGYTWMYKDARVCLCYAQLHLGWILTHTQIMLIYMPL